MTRFAFIGLFLLGLGAIVYVAFSAAGGARGEGKLERYARQSLAGLDFSLSGTPAPQGVFTLKDGTEAGLDSLRGKVILVNYWATWCGPCEREMPALGALQQARGGPDFEVVAISVDDDKDAAYAAQRLGELGAANITFRHAPLDRGEIIYGAGIRGFPTTIIYDPAGMEVARLSGEADWAALEAVSFIDAVLAMNR
jgi:thiol-disulfide isomerase/thioredoxin